MVTIHVGEDGGGLKRGSLRKVLVQSIDLIVSNEIIDYFL